MYQALYRKYRPKTFDEVIGQDVIVKTLKNSIRNNIVSHAYLLSGPRGTGKTTIAKIFAKVLNCSDPVDFEPCNKCLSCNQANNNQNIDIIEIDAASNNGVDEIREIRNKITLVPTNSKYKIYIIDEVHMLTTQAFNALLKTLEEPPAHIIFIFATTEPQKIPKTILSRCQRFDYKKVSNQKIAERLRFIANQENIKITDEALLEIAILSDGGVRDSISLLDQAFAYSDDEITLDDIHAINGTLLDSEIQSFIIDLLNKNLVEVMKKIEKYDNEGKNMIKVVNELIEKLKDCLIYMNAPSLIESEDDFYENVKKINNIKDIYTHITSLSLLVNEMKNVNNNKLLLEVELIKNIKMDEYIEVTHPKLEKSVQNIQNPLKKESYTHIISQNIEKNNNKLGNNVDEIKKIENIEPIWEIIVDKEKMKQLKTERINNSLCKFSQKERIRIKKELDMLDDYLSDEKYGKLVSLLKDGDLKAVSDNYLMFMYKTDLMADSFNQEIMNIESFLKEKLGSEYNVIGINLSDWDYLKVDYNSNKEKYVHKPETVKLSEVFVDKKNEKNEERNSIDEMFNDIIVIE